MKTSWLSLWLFVLALSWSRLGLGTPFCPAAEAAVPEINDSYIETPLSELAAKIKPPLYFNPEKNEIMVDRVAAAKLGSWVMVDHNGKLERHTLQSIRQDYTHIFSGYWKVEKYDPSSGTYKDGNDKKYFYEYYQFAKTDPCRWRFWGREGERFPIFTIDPARDKVALERLDLNGKVVETVVVTTRVEGHFVRQLYFSGDVPSMDKSHTVKNVTRVIDGNLLYRIARDFGSGR
jgi:hypothetical protein